MEACIIAVNSGHELCMGYAAYQRSGSMALKPSSIPVLKNKNILVGISGNEKLMNDLKASPLILSMDVPVHAAVDTIRNSIRNDYMFDPQVLVLATNNYIYHWHGGYVDPYSEFDEGYLAVGTGSEVAMGAIYGLRSSRYTIREQVEIAIKAVVKFYPTLGQGTGVLSL